MLRLELLPLRVLTLSRSKLLPLTSRGMSTTLEIAEDRQQELASSLQEIRGRVSALRSSATLIAVSKLKPASDVAACMAAGQIFFGENYVQELVEKAAVLPQEVQWHFIGTLQSNKAKTLAAIPNLHTIQTLTSIKTATALNKSLPPERTKPLNVFLQVNTSGEDAKSGLQPLHDPADKEAELVALARHVITECPRLRLQGLMTIGALEQSLSRDENQDFEVLKETRTTLQAILAEDGTEGKWGQDGKLLLSMGMSSDFEIALKAGSDVVRVGQSIFGKRPPRNAT